MTDEAIEEEVLLPSANPLELPQSKLHPAFVNPNADGLPWVEIGMDIKIGIERIHVENPDRDHDPVEQDQP